MNYRERIRKAIECLQFGNINYGEWGALRLDQRKNIKRLLDEMDKADEVIKHQYFEIERLHSTIKEVREIFKYYGNKEDIVGYSNYNITGEMLLNLLEILDKENK